MSESFVMKISRKGQITIPSAMRRKHGLLPQHEIKFVDQPDGILVIKAGKTSRGKNVVDTLMRGGKVKGTTKDLLKLTRGTA